MSLLRWVAVFFVAVGAIAFLLTLIGVHLAVDGLHLMLMGVAIAIVLFIIESLMGRVPPP